MKQVNNKNNQAGFTLIETLTAVAMFAVVIFLLSGIFKSVIDGQRSAIAAQNTQESMAYTLEIMSKELRTAKIFDDLSAVIKCSDYFGVSGNKIFNVDSISGNDIIYFRNKNNFCVSYFLENDGNGVTRLKITRENPNDALPMISDYITPDEIKISNLNFSVVDNLVSEQKLIQPKVTIKMDVEMAGGSATQKQKMKIQTTVSSRNYNEF